MGSIRWLPQPGPQLKAIEADWCDELFFGGARGGGKSDFLLGDYLEDIDLGDKWRGIIFRKTYNELEELQIRARELFPAYGGEYKSNSSASHPFTNCWYFPGGATLKMRYLEHERDADGYQGHQYCVAVGTRILMADGSPKNIEDICAGDYVATLEGAKMVTATVKPYAAPCVQMIGDGVSQVHPVWHPVLTASGWQSYASVLGIDSTEFAKKFQATSQHPCVNLTVKRAVSVPWLGTECREPKSSQGACSKHVSSDVKRRGFLRLALRCIAGLLPVLLKPQRTLDCCPSCATCDVLRGAQNGLKQALGFLGRCFDGFRLNDEQPRGLSDSDQDVPPSLGGAASHNRASCRLDVLDNIPLHIRQHEHGYQHPYALSEVSTEWESSLAACKLSFVGERLVADITVQDANHYITHDQGTINKNTWIGFDELTNHATPYGYNKLKACLRNPFGIHGRIRASGNPGGKGHIWVKARFIDQMPPYTPFDDPETGLTRMFIPSKVTDNKYLRDNKQYIALLKSSGSVELVKAWLDGDWDVVAGAFFDCWDRAKHVIRPFAIPRDWQRFRSFDWGSSRPFSVGWWAIADGSTDHPRGAIIRYREWYGASEPNVGLKLTAEDVARGIVKRSGAETFAYSVADPSCWKVDGGPSIAERMLKEGVLWRRADNQRINGWDQMRGRFVGMDDQPMIYTFDTCVDSIRTIPLLQHDETHPEDIDTDMEDHAADDWRYACMSRPWIKPVEKPAPARYETDLTISEIIRRRTMQRLGE